MSQLGSCIGLYTAKVGSETVQDIDIATTDHE